MREKKRYLHLATILVIVFAALLLILSGCESAGAGGGDSDGSGETSGSDSPGEALDLPEGAITAWDLGTPVDAEVILYDSSANPVWGYGPVTVEGGYFPGMTIDPPPVEALLSWSEFQEAFEYELLELPVNITDDSLHFQSFCYLDVPSPTVVIVRGTDERSVIWIYADGSTSITITDFDTGDYLATIDLQLELGWNRAVLQLNESEGSVTLKTEEEPTGTGWILK
jgi:hypothetical protein